MGCGCAYIKVIAKSTTKKGWAVICATPEKDEDGNILSPVTRFFEVEDFHDATPHQIIKTTWGTPLIHAMSDSEHDTFACETPEPQFLPDEGDEDDHYEQSGEEVTPDQAMGEATTYADGASGEEEETILTKFEDGLDWGGRGNWHFLSTDAAPSQPVVAAQSSLGIDQAYFQKSEVTFRNEGGKIPIKIKYEIAQYDDLSQEISRTPGEVDLDAHEHSMPIQVNCDGGAALAIMENVTVIVPRT